MRHLSPSSRLPPETVTAALMLATVAAAVLTALLFAVTALCSPFGGVAVAIPVLALAFFIACPAWLAGLVVVGLPCWWMLHQLGVRSMGTAALAGALLTLSIAGGYFALSSLNFDSPVPTGAWVFAASLTAIGGTAGAVVAKVAYPEGATR